MYKQLVRCYTYLNEIRRSHIIENCRQLYVHMYITSKSRGVKRQIGSKSLPYKTYLPKGLTQNNHGFQCSLAQIKNGYPLSGLFREKTVENSLRPIKLFGAYRPLYTNIARIKSINRIICFIKLYDIYFRNNGS